MTDAATLVSKLWNYCNVLRDERYNIKATVPSSLR